MKESEIEEKHAQKDYTRVMGEAKATRKAAVKELTTKNAVKAETEDKLIMSKELVKSLDKELHEIEMYLARLHTECDFLLKNFENRHMARVDEEVGLETAETIVTHEEPPSHTETEDQFEAEHSKKQVEQHFPEEPMPTPPPVF